MGGVCYNITVFSKTKFFQCFVNVNKCEYIYRLLDINIIN